VTVPKQLFSPTKTSWGIGFLLSLTVGGLFFAVAAKTIEHDSRERFIHQARNAQYSIASRIKAYTDVLRGTASYFQASGHVSRAAFHSYVEGLDLTKHFTALDNINYAEVVRDEDRAAFEHAYEADATRNPPGYPARLAILPEGRRASYSVITMIEPADVFGGKIGTDMHAKPRVAAALDRARDHGTLSASGRPIDTQPVPNAPWLAMRLPIYRDGMPLDSVEERRAAHLGSVGIGFSVQRLVRSALEETPERQMRLRLYDGGELHHAEEDSQVLLFDSHGDRPAEAGGDADNFEIMLPLDFNGRLWRAYFNAPKTEWTSRFDVFLPWLAMLTGFTGSLLFYLLFHTLSSSRQRAVQMAKDMTRELRQSQAKLQQSHHKLRQLAAHADQIKEEERKRIAREIHDDLGQNLLALRIDADMLAGRTRFRHPRLHARAVSTLTQIDATIKSVRNIINDLRPTVLDLGLGAAVEWQIAQFRQRVGLMCELVEQDDDIVVDDKVATALFRILQESLSNIHQHAQASLVRVVLSQQDGMLSMTISDNGIGMREQSRNKTGSFGLVGIEERISILGGRCAITSTPNGGTTISVSLPVTPPDLPPYAGMMGESVLNESDNS